MYTINPAPAALLRNFLGALEVAKITPKRRFLLQTGAKNYGIHLGPFRTPAAESDPRVTIEPNFYYPQEDMLFEWCKKNSTHWNIICPACKFEQSESRADILLTLKTCRDHWRRQQRRDECPSSTSSVRSSASTQRRKARVSRRPRCLTRSKRAQLRHAYRLLKRMGCA